MSGEDEIGPEQIGSLVRSRDLLASERDELKQHLADAEVRIRELEDQRAVLVGERDSLRGHVEQLADLRKRAGMFAPGHFYSPIPDLDEVRRDEARLFPQPPPRDIPAIDLHRDAQLGLLRELGPGMVDLGYPENSAPPRRFYRANGAFGVLDAAVLGMMLRHFQPKTIVEVGSGFSSAAMLDVSEHFLEHSVRFTFIEPLPEVLMERMREDDLAAVEVVATRVQDAPVAIFDRLNAGDILLIDSTHVSKIGSDVNYLLFEVLPRLRTGVIIHIHDIDYPFEYRKRWVLEGRFWNEAYLVRAFLTHNDAFEILLFNAFLQQTAADQLAHWLPDHDRNPGGSLWMRKVTAR